MSVSGGVVCLSLANHTSWKIYIFLVALNRTKPLVGLVANVGALLFLWGLKCYGNGFNLGCW